MEFLAPRCSRGSRRRGSALILSAIIAAMALTMAMASPALAASVGVMAWGDNEQGQLGNGTTTSSDLPVAASGLMSGVSAISAGSLHSLALLSNGTVMDWGDNESGQLGVGTHTGPETCSEAFRSISCSKTPVAVSGLSGIRAVSGGGRFSLALPSNGTATTHCSLGCAC